MASLPLLALFSLAVIAQDITENCPPTRFDAPDAVNHSVRMARDRLFGMAGLPPISAGNPQAPPRVTLQDRSLVPELPVQQSDVIVVATVVAADSHMLPGEAGIYTEYRARASRVVSNHSKWNGPALDIVQWGGAIQTKAGRVLRHLFQGQGTPIEIGREYLIFLQYVADADCFRFVKVWRVQAGVLRTNADDDTAKVKPGASQVDGKPLESVLARLSPPQQ